VQQIARNVLGVAAATIPSEVVEHTKALILDSIGCALAATEEPAFARASRVLEQLGGNPDCTVIGSAWRVNLPQAVLLSALGIGVHQHLLVHAVDSPTLNTVLNACCICGLIGAERGRVDLYEGTFSV
jgi:2-methylcitrate dehydratase PrpD